MTNETQAEGQYRHKLPENYDELIGDFAATGERAIDALVADGEMLPSVELFARGLNSHLKQFAIINRITIPEYIAILGRVVDLTRVADGAARVARGQLDEQAQSYMAEITPDILVNVAALNRV